MTKPRSLQRHLLTMVLTAVLVVWASAAVLIWIDGRHEVDELLDGHLAQAAALLVVQQTQEIGDDKHESADAPQLHRYAPKVAFQVWHDGALTLRSPNAPDTLMWPKTKKEKKGFATLQLDGEPWRVFTTHGAERDVQVFVAEQLDSRASIVRALLYSTLKPVALALPLLALVVWWAVRRGTRPLRALGRALAEREPRALHPVTLQAPLTEMMPMVDALNGLLRRIGEMVESERRFTADAAHELRTPIAAIRTQAQVALAESDDGARRHALQATVQGCDRATHLVEQLLTLSRLEAGAGVPAGDFDMAALARRVVADLAPAALARQQTLSLEAGDAPCTARGDVTLLSVLLRNLVDNAVRYSPAGASVRVTLSKVARGVCLRVEDSGPGLSEADAAHLGERFFRVLGSGEAGSGLGWSIVRRIADASGAGVRIGRSAALGGLSVEVTWPAAS